MTFDDLPAPPAAHSYPALERVLFGQPARDAVPEEIARMGAQRVFIITTRSLVGAARFTELVAALGDRCAGVYAGVRAFAPRDDVIEGAKAAREARADLLLAVGGGSVIDATKVMLLCVRHGYADPSQLDAHAEAGANDQGYRGADADRWLRMVAVPTTLSAAEYTARGGSMKPSTRKLEAFSGAMMIPRAIVNAPEMTLDSPLPLLLATGMKAVDHAVERLTSAHANAYSDSMSQMALRYLSRGLPRLMSQPADVATRAALQYGVFLSMGGRASGVDAGLSHGIGHQLGSYAGVSHGETTCVLLPAVLRWIGDARPGRLQLICEAIGAAGDDAAGALHEFIGGLGLPTRLRDVGVKREDLPEIARRTMDDPLIHNCPREVKSATDVHGILEAAW